MYFRKYALPKASLDKYQKSTASEYRWTSNMVKGPKQCYNLNRGTFIKFIDHYEGNCV